AGTRSSARPFSKDFGQDRRRGGPALPSFRKRAMSDLALPQRRGARTAGLRSGALRWIGVAPFLAFALLFLILPTIDIVIGAFQKPDGSLTLENIEGLGAPNIVNAAVISLELSLLTAALGCVLGLILAAAVTRSGLPRWLRDATLTFSGVASNFAGVP